MMKRSKISYADMIKNRSLMEFDEDEDIEKDT